ncbi:hypothetical protein SLS56_006374 [Neofusicoccum ribis]|uniref:Uncharacterized protein n=1 Tax=Neofusicoccum ribis TaxID=45134 RepID=A0ABR3SRN3_9PEZI
MALPQKVSCLFTAVTLTLLRQRNEHITHKIEHFARTLSRKVRRPRATHEEQQQQEPQRQQSPSPPARVPADAETRSDSPRSHIHPEDDAVHLSGEDAETEAIIQAAIADPRNGIKNYWGDDGDDEGLYEGG